MSETDARTMFASIVRHLTSGVYVLQDERAIFLNQRFGEIFGLSAVDKLLGRDFFTEIYPDPQSSGLFRQVHRSMIEQNTPTVAWAQPSARRDGTPFWVEVEAHLIEVDGKPAIFGTFKDQTDCQLIARAMHVSQETLRLVLDAMEDRVYVVTDDYRIVYANRKMREAIGGDQGDTPCYRACRALAEPCADCGMEQVFSSGRPVFKEFFNEKNGRWYSVIELAIPMPDVHQPTKLAVARDITRAKNSEQRIRTLSQQVLSAHEEERKRLARELHDDLGQRLNTVKMGLDLLAGEAESMPSEMQERIAELDRIVHGTIHSVRRITSGLRPPDLERLGLAGALREHCARLNERHPLQIDFKTAGLKGLRLDGIVETKIYRVAQEALHNVVRHAGAERVVVRLLASHPFIRLLVQDDGRGFDVEAHFAGPGSKKFGLIGMAERAELLHGSLSVDSSPGQGTRIALELPCQEA